MLQSVVLAEQCSCSSGYALLHCRGVQ
jgi:hypothetical protein